jgi:hypothetical protein
MYAVKAICALKAMHDKTSPGSQNIQGFQNIQDFILKLKKCFFKL